MTDRYYMRRVVSWVAFHVRKGADLEGVLAAAAKRKPPFAPELIREAYPVAVAAVANVNHLCSAGPNDRLCDLPGVVLPKE